LALKIIMTSERVIRLKYLKKLKLKERFKW
jgi:hypothetical protein